jgi:hypothetical protein
VCQGLEWRGEGVGDKEMGEIWDMGEMGEMGEMDSIDDLGDSKVSPSPSSSSGSSSELSSESVSTYSTSSLNLGPGCFSAKCSSSTFWSLTILFVGRLGGVFGWWVEEVEVKCGSAVVGVRGGVRARCCGLYQGVRGCSVGDGERRGGVMGAVCILRRSDGGRG